MQKTLYRSANYRVRSLLAFTAIAPFVLVSEAKAKPKSGVSGLAQREIVRRQEAVAESDRLFLDGRNAFEKKDYQQALEKFRVALSNLPESASFADRRTSYTQHISDASISLAQQFRKEGKYQEARTLLEGVVSPQIDPSNTAAKMELSYLDDPIRTNSALTDNHTKNVEQVRRALFMAQGNFDLGKFDQAKLNYEEVLRIDPQNSAARRGMEKIANTKSDYFRAAYDHTRAELLMQVDQAWELTVPAKLPQFEQTQGAQSLSGDGVAYIKEKLRRIRIPSISFDEGTSLEDAIDLVRARALELDTLELDPDRKGLNIVIQRRGTKNNVPNEEGQSDAPLLAGSDLATLSLNNALRLRDVPLETALKYICDMTKLRYKVDDFAVTLVPQTDTAEDLFTRNFQVPPDFVASLSSGGGGATEEEADPFASDNKQAAGSLKPRPPIIELLKQSGITFVEGSSATLSSSGTLLVTNTPSELDKIDQLIAATSNTPKQVKITTKFVEISQENTDELGFDWIISPFELSALNLNGFGGAVGNAAAKVVGNDVNQALAAAGGQNGSGQVQNIITSGLRSGDSAYLRNNIDTIINNPNRTAQNPNAAPSILGIQGSIFNDEKMSMIMRGLSQKKGADLMTAPSVTARSGGKAKIEMIREFIYPTEYEPPELPQNVGSTPGVTGGTTTSSSGGIFPVTPATPTSFETRNTGVTLEIEPTIGENDFVIDVRFLPEIVEFEGFINYGSPIQASAVTGNNVVPVIITENRIEMPVFSKRSVETALTIYDGYTVAVGGLMREDVQSVEDKVPIFGDIPFIGRLFQSKGENRIKSNLIIFLKAEIIDATGRPIRGNEESSSTPVSSEIDGGLLPPPVNLPE